MRTFNLPNVSAWAGAFLLLGMIALTSCTERVETELSDSTDPRLVVEGWITDQVKAHKVRLTMSGGYYANEAARGVSDAQVTIDDGQLTFPLTEQPLGSGNYFTAADVAGSPGHLYTLKIISNGTTYTASDMMKAVAPVDAMTFEYDDDMDYEEGQLPLYKVRIWTQETPGAGDHYRWISYVNGIGQSDSLKNASFADDKLFEGAEITGVTVDAVRARPGDTVLLQQLSISSQAFNIIEAILKQTEWRGGLFDAPPANVPGNISNGALGFFGAASVKERTGTIPY